MMAIIFQDVSEQSAEFIQLIKVTWSTCIMLRVMECEQGQDRLRHKITAVTVWILSPDSCLSHTVIYCIAVINTRHVYLWYWLYILQCFCRH